MIIVSNGDNMRNARLFFIELYGNLFYIFCGIAVVISVSFSLRGVRGIYNQFTLTDNNSIIFYLGSLLVLNAIFISILRLLGPISYSSTELFWCYSGKDKLPQNPWRIKYVWITLAFWATLILILSTVFSPNSILWFIISTISSLIFSFLLLQGLASSQILNNHLLYRWSLISGFIGTVVSILSTTSIYDQNSIRICLIWVIMVCVVGVLLSAIVIYLAIGKSLDKITAVNAYASKNILVAALNNIGSPDSYKYYGSGIRFFRKLYKSSDIIVTSISSVLDSYANFICILAISLPLGIYSGIQFGLLGPGIITIMGCWIIATFYRWLVREWVAQPSLRFWLGGHYLKTSFKYSSGPSLAACLYAVVMTCVFGLPLHAILVGFLLGMTTALGDPNPPKQINYELLIITQDGVMIPMEYVKAVLLNTTIIVAHVAGLYMSPIMSIVIALIILAWRTQAHYRKGV